MTGYIEVSCVLRIDLPEGRVIHVASDAANIAALVEFLREIKPPGVKGTVSDLGRSGHEVTTSGGKVLRRVEYDYPEFPEIPRCDPIERLS